MTRAAAESPAPGPIPIVALDYQTADEALAMVDRLGDSCRFYKVGAELFTAAGPQVVQSLRSLGHDVFLDLKLHDIPNTVLGAARSAAQLGVRLLTVHASGGQEMVESAVEGAGQTCGILGVTVLTSFDAPGLGMAWGRGKVDVRREVIRLAGIAQMARAHGVVCAGREAGALGRKYGPGLRLLVPGIRAENAPADDQKRTVTPAAAAKAGAAYVVLGRMVTRAPDPRSAFLSAGFKPDGG